MKKAYYKTKESRMDYLSKREELLAQLNLSKEGIDEQRLIECKEAILKAYKDSSNKDEFASVRMECPIEEYSFRSIGMRRRIEKHKFNAKDYYWGPYFWDVGRAISLGEQKYFFSRFGDYIRGCDVTISRRNPDFNIINIKINEMLSKNIIPDTIIYPVQMSVAFFRHYRKNMDWSSEGGRRIFIENCTLRSIWSNKFAKLRSFIIMDSKAGEWHTELSTENKEAISIAIGESKRYKGYVEYIAETLVYYKIMNKAAFIRINLSK